MNRYWQEPDEHEPGLIPDDIQDLAFAIRCRALPVDHHYALREAVLAVLPWLADEPDAGIHAIHVAASGNGWQRPAEGLLYPSRRTKLTLRLPRGRLADARALIGRELELAGHTLEVGEAVPRPLSPITTIFSRHVVAGAGQNEENFLAALADELAQLGVRPKKMLCGTESVLRTPDGKLHTRTVMLADLTLDESLCLQQKGVGPHRLMGCGLFIPHKGIARVGD